MGNGCWPRLKATKMVTEFTDRIKNPLAFSRDSRSNSHSRAGCKTAQAGR